VVNADSSSAVRAARRSEGATAQDDNRSDDFPFDTAWTVVLFSSSRSRTSGLKDEPSPPRKEGNRSMIDITKHVNVGQTVRLDELAWGYQLTVLPPEGTGLKVVAVGTDFVVLEDETVGVKVRLPGHLIKPQVVPAEPVVQAA
jgi:hypothetical protein